MDILTIEQRHNLGKALLFCLSKIYSALYVHHDFRTNFNVSTCTCTFPVLFKSCLLFTRVFSPVRESADNLSLMKKTLFLHSFYEITK